MPDHPLKVFLSDPHERGGGQVRYVTNLAQELMRRGHEVTIGCKPGSLLAQRAREIGCTALDCFNYRGGLRPRAWLADIAATRRHIRSAKPDIVHASGSQDHWVSAIANRLAGSPACMIRTRHNTYTVKDNWPNRQLNLRLTHFQIVVCDVVRKQLERQRTFDGTRMVSIHNGVDAALYAPEPNARARARAELGYTDEHVVCGIAARLVEAKGHTFLIKSVRSLVRDFPQLRILILGQGALEAALKKQVQDAGLDDIVNFAGFRDDMPYYTQAFDIGVLPSIDCDTSSFSLKEEMAAEKPVIASDYGGLREILSDGVEGFVVPAGTVEPIGSALRRLLQDPGLREKMGKAGRLRVLRDFTIEIFSERTIAAYRRALKLRQGKS